MSRRGSLRYDRLSSTPSALRFLGIAPSRQSPTQRTQAFQTCSSTRSFHPTPLRNSRSILSISCARIPETSAQVLLVYVLSSRYLLEAMRAATAMRNSLPGWGVGDVGFIALRRRM